MRNWNQCPRCGHNTFESLRSYSHCVECLYFQDRSPNFESSVRQAIGIQRELDRSSGGPTADTPQTSVGVRGSL
ncbi:hypothetical protein BH10BDE1_BH10BDE1_28130 [soil metagenome]